MPFVTFKICLALLPVEINPKTKSTHLRRECKQERSRQRRICGKSRKRKGGKERKRKRRRRKRENNEGRKAKIQRFGGEGKCGAKYSEKDRRHYKAMYRELSAILITTYEV